MADSDVLTLTDRVFDAAVGEHDVLLVNFYAPSCGHCKTLAPHYEKAATALRAVDIYIAKVDATVEKKIAQKYGVRSFPSLKLFKGLDSVADYGGERTERDIVSYMKKKTSPAVRILLDADATAKFIDSEDVVVIGFYEDLDSAEFNSYQHFADTVDDITSKFVSFGAVADTAAAAKYDIGTFPSTVLFKKEGDEGRVLYEGGMASSEGLTAFVKIHSLPSLMAFTPERSLANLVQPI